MISTQGKVTIAAGAALALAVVWWLSHRGGLPAADASAVPEVLGAAASPTSAAPTINPAGTSFPVSLSPLPGPSYLTANSPLGATGPQAPYLGAISSQPSGGDCGCGTSNSQPYISTNYQLPPPPAPPPAVPTVATPVLSTPPSPLQAPQLYYAGTGGIGITGDTGGVAFHGIVDAYQQALLNYGPTYTV